jgi:hypothetical protein
MEHRFDENDDLFSRTKTIKGLLQEHVCEVTFTKVDGSIRIMPCTLKPGSFPVVESAGTNRPKKDDNLSVWCTDQEAWRSFKLMNVTQIRTVI